MENPRMDLDINCQAQLSILEAVRKYNPGTKVIFASTRQLYGKPDYLPVDEKHPLRPVDVNGINKLAGEMYHILYNNVYGIPTCALRLTNTYGPGMRIKDARQTFLGVWIRLLVADKPFEVWEGTQLRDFTYVDDVVTAILMCAENDQSNGQVFNLGGERPISLNDLALLLVHLNQRGTFSLRSFPIERKRIDIGDYYADYGLIQSRIGWKPSVPLEKGLQQTLAFYHKNISHYL
jgi:nucleoside-diphosphate-sugar epimerase